MPKTSPRQRKTIGRVMHEYEHGELKSGPEGKGGKVKSRRQAIAIALNEAGASKYESPKENRENLDEAQRSERRNLPARDGRQIPCRRKRTPGEFPRNGRQERNTANRIGQEGRGHPRPQCRAETKDALYQLARKKTSKTGRR